MKNQHLSKGNRLGKKQLRSITGGLQQCIDPFTGQCKAYGRQCAESECRYVIEP